MELYVHQSQVVRGGSGIKSGSSGSRGDSVAQQDCYILSSLRFDVLIDSNSLTFSWALVRFSSGSHVASWSGYPTHLMRYWAFFLTIFLSRMASTSYSSWLVSGTNIAGGGVDRLNSLGDGW